MKAYFIITLLTTVIIHVTYSQRNSAISLNPCHDSNWKLKVDILSKDEFDQTKKTPFVTKQEINGDSLLKVMAKEFPNTIKVKDSCCILYGLDKEIKLCRKSPEEPGDQSFYGYNIEGFSNGYLILMEYAYETWSYIVYNPVNRKYAYCGAFPVFITDNLFYSCSNYYGIGYFEFIDLENNKTFCFNGEWDITGFYHSENFIFIEMNGHAEPQFFKIKYR